MKLWKRGLAALMCVVMTACAGSTAYQQAKDEEAVGHWDLAVMSYARAVETDPTNSSYKIALERAKMKASQVHFEKGKIYRASGRPDLAVVELAADRPPRPDQRLRRARAAQGRRDVAKPEAERGRRFPDGDPQEEDAGGAGATPRCSSLRATSRST